MNQTELLTGSLSEPNRYKVNVCTSSVSLGRILRLVDYS